MLSLPAPNMSVKVSNRQQTSYFRWTHNFANEQAALIFHDFASENAIKSVVGKLISAIVNCSQYFNRLPFRGFSEFSFESDRISGVFALSSSKAKSTNRQMFKRVAESSREHIALLFEMTAWLVFESVYRTHVPSGKWAQFTCQHLHDLHASIAARIKCEKWIIRFSLFVSK